MVERSAVGVRPAKRATDLLQDWLNTDTSAISSSKQQEHHEFGLGNNDRFNNKLKDNMLSKAPSVRFKLEPFKRVPIARPATATWRISRDLRPPRRLG